MVAVRFLLNDRQDRCCRISFCNITSTSLKSHKIQVTTTHIYKSDVGNTNMALKRPGSTPTMESSSNSHPNNSNNYPEEEENQRSNRRRKLTHSRVRFSEEVPTVHPRMEQREGEGLQQQQHPTREEIVKLWYSVRVAEQKGGLLKPLCVN